MQLEPQSQSTEVAPTTAAPSAARWQLPKRLRAAAPHEWFLLAVLLFMTDRYRWLMDDAFIYFRYADNLLFLDRGLVYNAGEYVEGFSSPLWMLLLLPLRALHLDYYLLIRLVALACAAAYGCGLIWVNRRLSPLGPIVNFPLAASAAHYGLTTHFSSGLETPLVQLIAPLFAAALLVPTSPFLQCCVALAPLVRPECGLLWLAFVPWAIAQTRRLPLWFLGVAAVANASWLLFRVYYYADFLPNTFYLKDTARWEWGLSYWQNVLETHHWPWVLLGLALCAALARKQLETTPIAPRFILLGVALTHAAYVARIGGDMLYHRYAALPVCLVLCASAGVLEATLLQLSAAFISRLAPVVALAIALLFGLAYPWQLEEHPLHADAKSRHWQLVADAQWHRQHKSLAYTPDRHREDVRQRELYERLRARGAANSSDASVIVNGFCRQGFRRFEAYVINSYGLTDALLARLPRGFGRPGHKLVTHEADQLKSFREHPDNEPSWVKDNRAAIAQLDRKIHNQHNLSENLRLALTPLHFR